MKITDKMRLDWMQSWGQYEQRIWPQFGRWWWYVNGWSCKRGSKSVRYAIDAAIYQESRSSRRGRRK